MILFCGTVSVARKVTRYQISAMSRQRPVVSCRIRYYMEVVSKHSGGNGKNALIRNLEEGTQLLSPTANGKPNPIPGTTTPAGEFPADGGNKAGGRNYQQLPAIATSALAGTQQEGHVTEVPRGGGGAQDGGGDASRTEGPPLEFAMV